jgi:hypothetical protein
MVAAKLTTALVIAATLGAGAAGAAPKEKAPRPEKQEKPKPLPRDYDPTVLLAKGAEPIQVFLKEPRNAPWARRVEAIIGQAMSRDLEQYVPEARGMGMTCHTLSCIIVVDAPAEKLGAALAVTKLVTLGPFTIDIPVDEDGKGRWLFFTERRMADPAAFTDWYLAARKRTLAGIREGKRSNPFPVTPDKVPQE